MNWLFYLLEANLYLSVFYAFYCLFLKKETYYSLNRWYLIITTVFSFLLPLISAEPVKQPVRTATYLNQQDFLLNKTVNRENAAIVSGTTNPAYQLTFKDLALPLYCIVSILLLAAIGKGIFSITKLYNQSEKFRKKQVVHVMLKHEREAFSFFNWLFYHPAIRPDQVILAHEMVHINQKHSADLLLFELLRAVNWFNPILWLMIKDVKINHEFIADEVAAVKGPDKYSYAKLLISYAGTASAHQLAHAIFNSSQLELRIDHLSKKRSSLKQRLKLLATIPLLVLLFLCSAFTINKNYSLLKLKLNGTDTVKGQIIPYIGKPAISTVKPGKSNPAEKKQETPVLQKKAITPSNSSLISGEPDLPKTTDKKPFAKDHLMDWAGNETNAPVRKPKHSIYVGTEAQLFRGNVADTLYIDKGYYELSDNQIDIKTDRIMVGKPAENKGAGKKLVVIDANTGSFLHTLSTVDIRTTAFILSVIPDDEINPGRLERYKTMGYNSHVRMARITGNDIITDESDKPDAPYQPDIIW